MAKLFNILAASVGGGILLGAGIRLGEALVSREMAAPQSLREDDRVAARLGLIEERLKHLEVAPSGPAIERHADAVETMRSEIATGELKLEALGEISVRLRSELQNWLESSVVSRLNEVESKLRSESEQSRKEMVEAFAETVQTRVMQRISRLEEEVAGQSTAMNELRECSLRTEQSVQRLLGGIDRLMTRQSAPPEDPTATALKEKGAAQSDSPDRSTEIAPAGDSAAGEEPPPPVFATTGKPRRWGIFG